MEKTIMTVQKIINELNKQYDWISRYQSNRQEKFKIIHQQCKDEKKKLQKKLGKQTNKSSRRKLEKKLAIVKKAYVMLDS